MTEFKIGDRVVYQRGVKEPLYNMPGTITDMWVDKVTEKLSCPFAKVAFDNFGTYDCMVANLDPETIKGAI